MRKLLFFLLILWLMQPAMAAAFPTPANTLPSQINTTPPPSSGLANDGLVKSKKGKKLNLVQKAKIKLLQMCQAKGYLVDGEMTAKQKRQAKWALILGLGSIVLLVIPYVGLLAIPAAITGLILGIKSVEGNSNTNGIIGIIASGLTLLLLLIAIAVVATMLVTWN